MLTSITGERERKLAETGCFLCSRTALILMVLKFPIYVTGMDRIAIFFDNLFTRRRWVVHFFFWLLILCFYVLFFGRKNENYSTTFFFVALLMPVTIATTYFVNYYLVPRYLLKGTYFFFGLYFFYTLLGSLFLETSIALLTFIVMAEVRIRDMSPASIDVIFLLTSLLLVIFFAIGIKMLLHWKQSKEDYQKLMREKVETELKFLKTQLNPHFLFNTLNNLYYLATVKSDKAPQAIMALSEVLDYILKEGKSTFVPLDREITNLRNYIALELLRYEDRVDIHINISGNPEKHVIAPMILITLMENAFKHGVMPVTGKSWVKFTIACTDTQISIDVENAIKNKRNGHGIGLENLKNQMNHLYAGNFRMLIKEIDQQKFGVNLVIETNRQQSKTE
jgi:sensor histidine kinase YesM